MRDAQQRALRYGRGGFSRQRPSAHAETPKQEASHAAETVGGRWEQAPTALASACSDNFAKGFFTIHCASCHSDDNRGDAARDYHLLANVTKEKAEIACDIAESQADSSKRGCTRFHEVDECEMRAGKRVARRRW
jgi:hypothetical protein